jgi:hypothetical protein
MSVSYHSAAIDACVPSTTSSMRSLSNCSGVVILAEAAWRPAPGEARGSVRVSYSPAINGDQCRVRAGKTIMHDIHSS